MRILFASLPSLLDTTSGAARASWTMLLSLARLGFSVEAICGSEQRNGRALDFAETPVLGRPIDASDAALPPDMRARYAPPGGQAWPNQGVVPITFLRPGLRAAAGAGPSEAAGNLRIFEEVLEGYRPDVLIGFGGGQEILAAFSMAASRGIATVFTLHNFQYHHTAPFSDADAILVASRFSARYHREALGLGCSVVPNLISDCRTPERKDVYLTFVNPSIEKGVFPFARIADELGRRRPDIPILVVESRGTEATVAACGLELRDHGTVQFMAHTADPRDFWGVTKACLLPSLWWENQPLVAVEAMVNGIPVIGSDRGGIPETLGEAGIVLPLPERITQATRMLPTAEEVEPWVRAVIRLWDDAEFYEEHRRKALAEARRWDREVLEPRYVEFFRGLKPGRKVGFTIPPGRAKAVALVPYLGVIEPECEDSLRKLEAAGVRVVRSGGNSAIDVARNRLASEALHDGAEAILFVDSDIGFDPLDALRLLARPEPVVSGVYAKKSRREFASIFAEGVEEVVFGAHAFGLYPLKYAATGFLRIKAAVLRRMVEELDLPHCNTHWGRGEWPFFQPSVVPQGEGRRHYLGEDWAFSDRLARIGVTPMADTSIRLWHYGRYAFGWEDAGAEPRRFATYTHRFGGRDG